MDYQIEHFKKYTDERGDLIVFLTEKNLNKGQKNFGQIYFVTFNGEGVVRGNHYHKNWREWFGIIHGKVMVGLEDVRNKKRKDLILDATSDEYIRLEIGPYISHAFKSLTKTASLLNYSNEPWRKGDTFESKIF